MRQSVCDRLEISERRWPRLALTLSRHVVECDHQSGAIAALSGGEGIERVPYAVPQEVEAEHDEDDEQSGCGQPDVVYEDLHSLRILQQHSPAHHGRHDAYSQEAQGALAKNETGYAEGGDDDDVAEGATGSRCRVIILHGPAPTACAASTYSESR